MKIFSGCLKMIRNPILKIPQGKLRGSTSANIDGTHFYQFQGIPYAQPPIGKLRFKAPVPPKQWAEILDATKEQSPSYGPHLLKKDVVVGSEDCLFLNVYTKNIPHGTNRLHPVMFQVHGGSFLSGCGGKELHGPDFLLTEDVVLVTTNYRLGLLGFLSLEDPSFGVPGNAAFKDVVMALKWVQTNIERFGGDPNNVTIMGQSVGAIIVHLLTLSAMGKNLFHKTIIQSGCATSPFARGNKGVQKIAEILNTKHDERAIYNRLMTMSSEEIFELQNKLNNFQTPVPSVHCPFGYVVEKPNQEAFLTEEPISIMLKEHFHHVPMIIGHTSRESLCLCYYRKRVWPGFQTCEDMIPHYLGYKVGSAESLTLAKELRKFYLGSEELATSNNEKLLMEGDLTIIYEIYQTAMAHFGSKYPVYLYRMSADTGLNLMKTYFKIDLPGAAHYDDLGYIFHNFLTPEIQKGSKEDIAMRRYVKLWTNFAKYGNPTPSPDDPLLPVIWKAVTNENMDFLDIGEDLVASSNAEDLKRVKFLESLIRERSIYQKCSL